MSLLYGDCIRNDPDILRLVGTMQALQMGNGPPPVDTPDIAALHHPRVVPATRSSEGPRNVVVSQGEGSVTLTPARSPPIVCDQRSTPIASPAVAPIQPAPAVQHEIYNVHSGRRIGLRETWADAGDATQGVPGGNVYKIHVQPPRPRRGRRKCVAYVVFEGLAPGIYNTWDEARRFVDGISGNVHQGFETRYEAERAYVTAFALGALRTLSRGQSIRQHVPAIPTPEAIMAAFAVSSDNFLGAEWHVVFKGRRPGIYPAWNFAASQTKGVGRSIYQKFDTKAEAESAYQAALVEGFVEVL